MRNALRSPLALLVLGMGLACSPGDSPDAGGTADTGCAPNHSTWCDGHKVWWVDGCGNRTAVKLDCSPGACYGDGCVSCTPDCTGMACGDDGCGGKCACSVGQVCMPDAACCTPHCPAGRCDDDGCGGKCACSDGQVCLIDGTCCIPVCHDGRCDGDGCGGKCDCPGGQVCMPDASCCAPACAPGFCGQDDGCDGLCSCSFGRICMPDHSCCTPTCKDDTCGQGNGCGGSCVCLAGQVCRPDGTCCTPICAHGTCGDDGCGGMCACLFGQVCGPDGTCCTPACTDSTCDQSDGCGGTCMCPCVQKIGKYEDFCKDGAVYTRVDGVESFFHGCPDDAPCVCGRCADGICPNDFPESEYGSCPVGTRCCTDLTTTLNCCGANERCESTMAVWNYHPPWCLDDTTGEKVCQGIGAVIVCHGNEVCCGWTPSLDSPPVMACCPPGGSCCGNVNSGFVGVCCAADEYCAWEWGESATCCKKGEDVCVWDTYTHCCPSELTCGSDECGPPCGADEIRCEGSVFWGPWTWCCPAGTQCSTACDNAPCCAAG